MCRSMQRMERVSVLKTLPSMHFTIALVSRTHTDGILIFGTCDFSRLTDKPYHSPLLYPPMRFRGEFSVSTQSSLGYVDGMWWRPLNIPNPRLLHVAFIGTDDTYGISVHCQGDSDSVTPTTVTVINDWFAVTCQVRLYIGEVSRQTTAVSSWMFSTSILPPCPVRQADDRNDWEKAIFHWSQFRRWVKMQCGPKKGWKLCCVSGWPLAYVRYGYESKREKRAIGSSSIPSDVLANYELPAHLPYCSHTYAITQTWSPTHIPPMFPIIFSSSTYS